MLHAKTVKMLCKTRRKLTNYIDMKFTNELLSEADKQGQMIVPWAVIAYIGYSLHVDSQECMLPPLHRCFKLLHSMMYSILPFCASITTFMGR
jgi:hypothetical protein